MRSSPSLRVGWSSSLSGASSLSGLCHSCGLSEHEHGHVMVPAVTGATHFGEHHGAKWLASDRDLHRCAANSKEMALGEELKGRGHLPLDGDDAIASDLAAVALHGERQKR